jgi:hypothetical protein
MLAKLRKVAQLFKRRDVAPRPSTRPYGFTDFRQQKRLSRFNRN